MTVYVDELFVTKRALADPQANRIFGNGRQSCHMTADTVEELLAMARAIRLPTRYLQHPARLTRHFDLTPERRAAAIQAGAVETTARADARRIAALMAANRGESISNGSR